MPRELSYAIRPPVMSAVLCGREQTMSLSSVRALTDPGPGTFAVRHGGRPGARGGSEVPASSSLHKGEVGGEEHSLTDAPSLISRGACTVVLTKV